MHAIIVTPVMTKIVTNEFDDFFNTEIVEDIEYYTAKLNKVNIIIWYNSIFNTYDLGPILNDNVDKIIPKMSSALKNEFCIVS